MGPDTVKAVQDALTPLADKIGAGADHLYPIFVRQALISGFVKLGIAALFYFCAIGLWGAIKKDYNKSAAKDDRDELVVPTLLALACFVVATLLLVSGIQHLANPQYYAIQDIICKAKGSCN